VVLGKDKIAFWTNDSWKTIVPIDDFIRQEIRANWATKGNRKGLGTDENAPT